ncbi:lysine--tRNA ligase [archaeon]|jgi:lysyl-tRNA synthetase, class I|nr:lysine--tRNA ligase [archaeon]MBT6762561.1 lysine--tRNA ligase [archaeon]
MESNHNFKISNVLFEKFPKLQIAVLKVTDLKNNLSNPQIISKLRDVENQIREKYSSDSLSNLSQIKTWREAYSSFGAKPKKYKSSIEALLRRVLAGEEIPSINPLVDTYNYISLKYLLPLGADDCDKITEPISLTYCAGTEEFQAINSDEVKTVNRGEVAYKMGDKTILCRRWNWREANQTKIDNNTKTATIYIESLLEDKSVLENALAELQELLGGQSAILDDKNNLLTLADMKLSSLEFNEFHELADNSNNKKNTKEKKLDQKSGVKPPFPLYHWADVTAHKIICDKGDKDKYTVAAGITPSGVVHIGNFREIITNELVKRALEYRGKKVRFLYSWDDFDVFRKVPKDMPKRDELQKELRKSIVDVFDPHGETSSYARHNQIPVEEDVKKVGIECEFIYQSKAYREGKYAEGIKHALQNTEKIKLHLNKHRKENLPENWLPIAVFSKFDGTDEVKNLRYDGEWSVSYEVSDGSTETVNFKDGGDVKLRWRIDWPMRWDFENVDFEPGGKDHSTKGGSFDTGRDIIMDLWARDAPTYIMYDFINVKGQTGKMSSSAGNVLTVSDVLKVYTPELLRYLFAGTRPNTEFCISFDVDVFKVYEDFDKCERIYFGVDTAKNEKESAKQKRIYELSAVDQVAKTMPYQPSFRHLTTVLQIHELDIEKSIVSLESELKSESDKTRLRQRAESVKYWLQNYAPVEFTFTVQTECQVTLVEKEKEILQQLAAKLEEKEWTDKDLHEEIYVLCTNNDFPHKDFFQLAYNVLINKKQGPKLASFILEIGRKRVAELLKKL